MQKSFFAATFLTLATTAFATGYFGVALSDSRTGGAVVAEVTPGGPADRAGLKPGDTIVAINGTRVDRASTLTRIVTSLAPNTTARVTVLRGRGRPEQIAVLVTGAPSRSPASAAAPPLGRGAPAIPIVRPPAPPGIRFTRFTDPLEHSFSLEVPAGWRTEGGLARLGLIAINPHLRSLSPDKMTYLLFGESTLPSFAPPSQLSQMRHVGEGFVYSAGLGQRVMIMHYMAGAEFARAYGQYALSNLCRDLKPVSAINLPDLARKAQAEDHLVMPTRYDAGEATFSCTHNKQEMQATIQAVTWMTNDSMMWAVSRLGGFIAPKARAAETGILVSYMAGTWHWDEKWTEWQNQLTRQAGDVIKQRIQGYERQQAAFNQKLNAMDENFSAVDEIITGNSTYHDAQTGRDYSLSNLTPFKWIDDSSGRIVGTETNVRPPFGYAFRALPRGQ